MITLSAALMKLAIEHKLIVLVVLVNWATVTVIDMVGAVCGLASGVLLGAGWPSLTVVIKPVRMSQTSVWSFVHHSSLTTAM